MTYNFGDWVVYDPGCKQEIGRVTECRETSAFVCYHQGCTAASTPLEHLRHMVASAYGADTPERAIEAAVVDMVGSLDMLRREGNCEDAVNVLAHAGYQFAYGPTPLMEMDFELMDGLFAAAKAYVERNSRFAGFEWEDVW